MKNFKVTAVEDGREYWISRAHAVVGIIYAQIPGKKSYYFLVSQRGQGCPDNVGKWSCTCGYLDWDETRKQAVQREVWEELGLQVGLDQIIPFCEVDDPRRDPRQNIVSRYLVKMDYDDLMKKMKDGTINGNSELRGGEPNETADVDFICINEIYKKDCAMIEEAAIRTNPEIWRYILKSVTLGLSYEFIEYDDEQGKIPMCRKDFYGTRKRFYGILNQLKLDHKLTDIP